MSANDYVAALQALINASRTADGPSLDEAYKIAEKLVPQEWIQRLLFGWQDYAKRYKKPLIKELTQKGSARFLSSRVLRGIRLGRAGPICTLCGQTVVPPRKTWHQACWQELEQHTMYGWKKICRTELLHSKNQCRICFLGLTKGYFQFDHIIPIALGGTNAQENIQVLCSPCHKEKTRLDMVDIRKAI